MIAAARSAVRHVVSESAAAKQRAPHSPPRAQGLCKLLSRAAKFAVTEWPPGAYPRATASEMRRMMLDYTRMCADGGLE